MFGSYMHVDGMHNYNKITPYSTRVKIRTRKDSHLNIVFRRRKCRQLLERVHRRCTARRILHLFGEEHSRVEVSLGGGKDLRYESK